MNREIKFRGWDGMKMQDNEEVMRVMYNLSTGSTLTRPLEYMQFTGLHDKNGKEIYEGDVFKDSIGNTIVVTWRKDLASFALTSTKWAYDHYFGEAVDAGNIEVIGNIYENSDLLK